MVAFPNLVFWVSRLPKLVQMGACMGKTEVPMSHQMRHNYYMNPPNLFEEWFEANTIFRKLVCECAEQNKIPKLIGWRWMLVSMNASFQVILVVQCWDWWGHHTDLVWLHSWTGKYACMQLSPICLRVDQVKSSHRPLVCGASHILEIINHVYFPKTHTI